MQDRPLRTAGRRHRLAAAFARFVEPRSLVSKRVLDADAAPAGLVPR